MFALLGSQAMERRTVHCAVSVTAAEDFLSPALKGPQNQIKDLSFVSLTST